MPSHTLVAGEQSRLFTIYEQDGIRLIRVETRWPHPRRAGVFQGDTRYGVLSDTKGRWFGTLEAAAYQFRKQVL